MSRIITFQPLKGTQAQLQILQSGLDPNTGNPASPLQLGEQYFAFDTGNLFFGTPGFGLGYIQVGDMSQVSENLDKLILLMESVRRALVAIACEGGRNNPEDFEPSTASLENSDTSSVLS